MHARLPLHGCLASLLAPGAQLQLLKAIPAVGLVDTDLESLSLQKDMQAPVAPPHAHLCHFFQTLPQWQLWILPAVQVLRTCFISLQARSSFRPSWLTMYFTTSRFSAGRSTFLTQRPSKSSCPGSARPPAFSVPRFLPTESSAHARLLPEGPRTASSSDRTSAQKCPAAARCRLLPYRALPV